MYLHLFCGRLTCYIRIVKYLRTITSSMSRTLGGVSLKVTIDMFNEVRLYVNYMAY